MQLWEQTDERPRLPASRCLGCGLRSFPAAARCRNCGAAEVEQIFLPSQGCIETFSSAEGRAVGEVRLQDGTLILGGIHPAESLQVGQPVRFKPHGEIVRFSRYG